VLSGISVPGGGYVFQQVHNILADFHLTSLEVFGNDRRICMSFCFLPDSSNRNLKIYSSRGKARILSLKVYELGSIWPESELEEADNG